MEQEDSIAKSEFAGELLIGELALPCAVLTNGTRVLSERGVVNALGGKRGGSHWRRMREARDAVYTPVFLSATNLAPFISASLKVALSRPVHYKALNGGIGYGVEATLLPEICNVFLRARRAGALTPQQEHIAATAEVLMSGLAHVGIIALVDEVTGFQEVRDRTELHKILTAYVSREFLPWSKRFPDEFYQELFRLRGWAYSPPQPKRPKIIGHITNQLVYEKLPPGVLEELKKKNPVISTGLRRHKHHQFLTDDVGHPHLEKHLVAVTTLMRASSSWESFKRLFSRAFPSNDSQRELDLGFSDEDDL